MIIDSMSSRDQSFMLSAALRSLGKNFSAVPDYGDDSGWESSERTMVAAAARYLDIVIGSKPGRRFVLVSWLTDPSGAGLGDGIGIRRAVIAALSRSKSDLELAFEKSLQQFGDQLYLKHTPILQQEGKIRPKMSYTKLTSEQYMLKSSYYLLAASFKSQRSNFP